MERQNVVPDSENKFGYEGKALRFILPHAVLPSMNGGDFPVFFELQITTLFQHAWSEAEHDLMYKPVTEMSFEEKRKIAFQQHRRGSRQYFSMNFCQDTKE